MVGTRTGEVKGVVGSKGSEGQGMWVVGVKGVMVKMLWTCRG